MQKKQATIKEIAKELNIAVSTVSRALQNNPRIGLRTRERVFEVAKKLNYVPNPAAILLKKNRTYTIGLLIPSLTEEFFSMAITAIEDVIVDKKISVMISQSRDKFDREVQALKTFLSSRVDGVIASVSGETNHYGHFKELENYGIPIVFFDRVPRNLAAHKVRSGVTEGAFEAIEFLVNKKVTKIALINGPTNLEASDERLNGYLTAIEKFNLKIAQSYVKTTDLSKEDTFRKMNQLLDIQDVPEAVLCFNDYVALYAMQACRERGVVPNKDVLFVSFANLPITGFMDNPPIASVEQFAYQMGETAANLLLRLINQKEGESIDYQEITISTKLIVH
ncbi:MAG: LacI family DNA-binding transcriptional regulator [Spirosomataceae bacterium]